MEGINHIDIFNSIFSESTIQPTTLIHEIVGYQIVRLEKITVGGYRRTIIDTYRVELGNTELAKSKALYKAKRIGKCMVIELLESVINSY